MSSTQYLTSDALWEKIEPLLPDPDLVETGFAVSLKNPLS
jgi:hypothetical protein